MLSGIPSSKAIDLYLCNLFKRTTTQETIEFLALHSDVLYTPETELEALEFVLSHATVNTKELDHNIQVVFVFVSCKKHMHLHKIHACTTGAARHTRGHQAGA